MEIKSVSVGDFVVERGTYGYELHKISSVTASLAHYIKYGNREGRIRKQDIVFCGTEMEARRLQDQLTSSAAQKMKDTSSACDRMRKRDEGFIAAALARLPTPPDRGT